MISDSIGKCLGRASAEDRSGPDLRECGRLDWNLLGTIILDPLLPHANTFDFRLHLVRFRDVVDLLSRVVTSSAGGACSVPCLEVRIIFRGHRSEDAVAICLNDYGPITSINDVLPVFSDEAAITNVLYRTG